MSPGHFDNTTSLEALLEMTDVVVRHPSLAELLPDVAARLHKIFPFDLFTLSLHDSATDMMRLHFREGVDLPRGPLQLPVSDTPGGWVWKNQRILVIQDAVSEPRFSRANEILTNAGIHSYCVLPLTTAATQLGAIGFGSTQPNHYLGTEQNLLQRVTGIVALAVENALNREHLQREKERTQLLLEVTTAIASTLELHRLFPSIASFIRRVIPHDLSSIAMYERDSQSLYLYALDPGPGQGRMTAGVKLPIQTSGPGRVFLDKQTKVFTPQELSKLHGSAVDDIGRHGFQSVCCVPLMIPKGVIGTLNVASKEHDAFRHEDVHLLEQIAAQIAVSLDNARAYSEIARLKDRLAEEKLYLEDEIRSELNFQEIIGESNSLKRVLGQVKTVAPSDATVLILGETGTGKELIARAIHRISTRHNASFIKMNCAAIPTGLLESELFGHEKGAFTGAISQKIGRLELADHGTLFLDEIGDIPLELQPKLLRVLQDQEFERLGSNRTVKVNVRLIAATNCDLEQAMADKQFRSDLFYRLNVFPIRVPALRDRREDIPQLVRYFVLMFCRRMNKLIETIPTTAMNAFLSWDWPGNVRELENFIERSVILSEGTILNAPLAELRSHKLQGGSSGTLESLEREHILRVLQETGGVIGGKFGAAARLGLKRTTLQSRIQRLGIARSEYQN